ncbi:MAG: hypothetical protein RIS17_352 [Pseudomonadota bacterium]|jgi:chemotaxis regulatin CheY-phosphate phosphatase CheZ
MMAFSPALTANVVMAILSAAMLVQSIRLLRGFEQLRASGLNEVVRALQRATVEASAVLNELRHTLGSDIDASSRILEEAIAIRDELAMIVEMGDATAERIVAAVDAARIEQMLQDARRAPGGGD